MFMNFMLTLLFSVLSFLWSKSIMSSLISLELSWCWIYMIMHITLSESLDTLLSSEVLSVIVCESVVGLSLLTSLTYGWGSTGLSLSGCIKI
uniref:NADH dehydrogenase subunit 4L n=2 Tax=Pediculus humanus TaxID=121225 RepID=X2D1G2_PEDHC|nr:NADH dehydrogenase subunit 4L [Pediculus humanus corporis]AHF70501.1 NADH dehydrogenase subunit 4L [Pediculus humanus corporis]AHF70503.1 NADH dehydrogenase subunit 4L [Pediculus humanus corporis]AHF70505.1 NADH dehydrogenase subunit 4L [Pediculus humanus capitis]